MSDTPETDQAAQKASHKIMLHAARRGASGVLNQYQVEDYIKEEFTALERRANDAEAKGKRVLARLIKARDFNMDMRAYQELQEAINDLQQ